MVTNSKSPITTVHVLGITFVLIMLLPYLVVLNFGAQPIEWDWPELKWALMNTIKQGLGTAILAVVGAAVLLPGLFLLKRGRGVFEFLLILPTLLPPIFILLVFLEVFDPFPNGNIGVVLVQGVMLSGLLAVQWSHWIRSNVAGMLETAVVLGASYKKIFALALRLSAPQLRELFLFAFVFSVASFSIPLAVGGGRGINLEILIYEKIRISQNWSEAVGLAAIQTLCILLLTIFLSRSTSSRPNLSFGNILASRMSFILGCLYLGVFAFVFLSNIYPGWKQLANLEMAFSEVFHVIPKSLVLSVALGGVTFVVLIFAVFVSQVTIFKRFLFGYIAPSTAVVGFAAIAISNQFESTNFIYILSFLILSLTGLYRLGVYSALDALSGQIDTARVLGASPVQIGTHILVPQLAGLLLRLSGLAAIWMLGDFALAKMIFLSDQTLAMLTQSLMESYRIDAALFLASGLLCISLIVYFIFWSIAYVCDKRLV